MSSNQFTPRGGSYRLTTFLAILLLCFAGQSCNSSGGGTSSGASACTNCVTGSFLDDAVTDFEQTSNIAMNQSTSEKILNLAIPKAYALENGKISCVKDQSVGFRMTALSTETFNVSTICNDLESIESDIRTNLIESMQTKGVQLELSYSDDGALPNAIMDMSNFSWKDESTCPGPAVGGANTLKVPTGVPGQENCYLEYLFYNSGDCKGRGVVSAHPDNVYGSGAGECDVDQVNWEHDTRYEFAFRFIDGYLEMDRLYTGDDNEYLMDQWYSDLNANGPNKPDNNGYERWTVK